MIIIFIFAVAICIMHVCKCMLVCVLLSLWCYVATDGCVTAAFHSVNCCRPKSLHTRTSEVVFFFHYVVEKCCYSRRLSQHCSSDNKCVWAIREKHSIICTFFFFFAQPLHAFICKWTFVSHRLDAKTKNSTFTLTSVWERCLSSGRGDVWFVYQICCTANECHSQLCCKIC